jgi:ABC-type sugar transport system ATPase subunit
VEVVDQAKAAAAATQTAHQQPLLEARGIAKSFAATHALLKVDLTIRAGEIHALLGGNGAGKSTLVKILLGAMQPTSGSILIGGVPVTLRSVAEALSAGIYPIYQQLSQFPHLSVRENLAAFDLGTSRSLLARNVVPPDKLTKKWLAEVGLECDLDAPVASLSIGEQQLLEIARSISRNASVLVLDEPTAALTRSESEVLIDTIRRLRSSGVGVLFISHKLEEVEELADRVTVIRDGICAISGADMSGLCQEDLVLAMVGHSVSAVADIGPPGDRTVVETKNLVVRKDAPPVNIAIREGEIVGLAGIVGCGADRIAAVIAGAERPLDGSVMIDGMPMIPGDRVFAVSHGVGYVPPDRHAEGLYPILKAVTNASASKLNALTRGGAVRRRMERDGALEWLHRLALHPLDLDLEASRFSGGNQQKLVVARNLCIPDLRLIVMSEPTRGVDVAARQSIHQAVVDAAARGTAVLVATSDVDELLDLSHRILVVRNDRIAGTFERGADRQAVVNALAEQPPWAC